MTVRYCPRCDTDVEDVGGFCLVGHRLSQAPITASISPLSDLRAEVDKAFEEARLQVAAALAPLAGLGGTGQTPTRSSAPPPPPPALEAEEEIAVPTRSYDGLFETMESKEPTGVDPINAFAPAPRMDWGPEHSSKLNGIVKRSHPENA
jgi:hypothetical protein